jgi:hypothetical protein
VPAVAVVVRRRSSFPGGHVNPEDESGPPSADERPQVDTRRWLLRLGVVALGLWFILDGLRGTWPAAGVVARVLLVVAVLFGVALLVLGVVQLSRRGRGD